MTEERNDLGGSEAPGDQGANSAVESAGEPSRSEDTRGLSAEQEGVTPEELDRREERFTGPRKPMGPSERHHDVSETTPEGVRPPQGRGPHRAG